MKTTVSTTDTIKNSALNELFIDELKDIYWAEKHLSKALPNMIKATTSIDLKAAMENYLEETETQITRLEHVFESIGEKAAGVKCEAMVGLIKEADELIHETQKGTFTRDVAIISAAQKVEHYEIASYGTMKTLAGVLGYGRAVELLDSNLQEEKDANHLLTQLARRSINASARSERK